MLDELEPVEAPHTGTGAAGVCDVCGKEVGNVGAHKRRAHNIASAGRPSRDRGPKPGAGGSRRREPPSLYTELVTTYTLVFQLWAMKDPICGIVALRQAPQIAAAWDQAQKSSPAVRKVLVQLLASSAWMGVAFAHVPILMAVVHHHGPQRQQYESFPPGPEEAGEPGGEQPFADVAASVASEAYGPYTPGSADAAR